MKELDCFHNNWIEYGQHENGMYWSQIRNAATNLVISAITAKTMMEIKLFWQEHNVSFSSSLPTQLN